MIFHSDIRHVNAAKLPPFTDTRIMMMPIKIGVMGSVPASLDHYRDTLHDLFKQCPQHAGRVGYLTIDEKRVESGSTHRRAGLHVDGVYNCRCGGWGGGGSWGSVGNGMLTVASHIGCRAWKQDFAGTPGDDGECDHLAPQCGEPIILAANHVYWLDGLCVHESIPQQTTTDRQFVRLSLPSRAPWFDGYTKNPLGILPTGPILPRRAQMDQ